MNYESPCIRKKKFLLTKNFSTRLSKISFDLHDRRKIERCKMSDVSLIKNVSKREKEREKRIDRTKPEEISFNCPLNWSLRKRRGENKRGISPEEAIGYRIAKP